MGPRGRTEPLKKGMERECVVWFYFYLVAKARKRGIIGFLDGGGDTIMVAPESQGLRICV